MNSFAGRIVILSMSVCACPLAAQNCDPADVFGESVSTVTDGEYSVAIMADFNEDGFLDLIGATTNETIELGNGDGTFQPAMAIDVEIPFGIDQMRTADLNGDGHLDVVATSSPSMELEVYVLLGAGDGTFTSLPSQTIANKSSQFGSFDLADINDDDVIDLITTTKDRLYTLPGVGDGTFGSSTFYAGFGQADGVTVGDLNGDGLPDIVVNQFPPSPMRVYLNRDDSPGDMNLPVDYPAPLEVTTTSGMTDLNADGALDVVVTNTTIGGLTVFLGAGNGTLQPFVNHPGPVGGSGLAFADLNGDSHMDVASNAGDLRVYYGAGDGSFSTIELYPSAGSPASWPQIGDVDLDGDLDVVFKGIDNLLNVNDVFFNDCTVAPQIVSHPAPLTLVDAGADVMLSVGIGIGTPPIEYQWRRNGVDMANGGNVGGVDTDTLMLSSATFTNTDTYDVVVSNDIGSTTSTSAVVAVRQTCYPDCNGDGVLNILDFVCFQGQFQAACP